MNFLKKYWIIYNLIKNVIILILIDFSPVTYKMFGYYCILIFLISFTLNLISYYNNSKLMRIPWFICRLILKLNINIIIIINRIIYPIINILLEYMPYRNHIKFILIIIYYILTVPWYCYEIISIILTNSYILIKILYKIFMELKECAIEMLELLIWSIYYISMVIRGTIYVIHLIY